MRIADRLRSSLKKYTIQVIISLSGEKWLIDKTLDRYQLTTYLTAPYPSYISLQTALYFHGMISQIPDMIYLITIDRTHRLDTPLGSYSLHHVHPDFFFGFTIENKVSLATSEKALTDFLYLSPAKSRSFATFPELSLPANFDVELAHETIERIPSKRTKTLVSNKLEELFKNHR